MTRAIEEYLGLCDKQKELKRFQTQHKQIVLLHLQGKKPEEIADLVGRSIGHVYNVLRSSQAGEIFSEYNNYLDTEFENLYNLSVDAVRDALIHGDVKEKLAAADRVFRFLGKDRQKGSSAVTAEDVIRRIFLAIEEVPVGASAQERQTSAPSKIVRLPGS